MSEGQEVEITVRTVSSIGATGTGQGFLLTESALADDPYWDAIMEEVHQERKNDSRGIPGMNFRLNTDTCSAAASVALLASHIGLFNTPAVWPFRPSFWVSEIPDDG